MFDGNKCEPSTSTSFIQRSLTCRHFEFHEIQTATENFDESLVIGRGGFGKVYKGNIINGSSLVVAAIKRLDSMSNQGASEFWAEVEMLSKLRHCHLVSLFGYCNYEKEMILVYEYMPNGTLEDHLHKLGTPLSWRQRLKMCIGSGRGLHYLHTGTGIEFGVIHRDVKSSNILLHDSWAAKISDFGLSRIGPTDQPLTYVNTLVKGTFGYLDPNYFTTGRLTRKSDVYAFGVVLLEILCRKRAVDRSLDEEQWGLVAWAQNFIKEGTLKHIIDFEIRGQISPKCLRQFVRIVDRCLHNNPKQRPTMAEVVVNLESLLISEDRMNRSIQVTGRTILARMFDMFPFQSNRGISARGDLNFPITIKGNSRTSSIVEKEENITIVDARGSSEEIKIPNPSLKVFKFVDLESATRNFTRDLMLGTGRFGEFFIGWINENTFAPSNAGDGIAVVVKRCRSLNSKGYDECQEDVGLLGQLSHPNIVSLLGYCNHGDENLLVYEYIENRSLDIFLFTDAPDIAKPLSWRKRLRIMIGVARGLTYLHSSKDQVICRGVQSSDILLDQDFNAKLLDFGLAKSGLEFGQTNYSSQISRHRIVDPEYTRTGHFSVKSDIYSLGVVLLETLTALPAIGGNTPHEQCSLLAWACQILANKRNLKEIMDPRLEEKYPLEGAFECGALALRCVANKPRDRPSSKEVLHSLERIYAVSKIWKDRSRYNHT